MQMKLFLLQVELYPVAGGDVPVAGIAEPFLWWVELLLLPAISVAYGAVPDTGGAIPAVVAVFMLLGEAFPDTGGDVPVVVKGVHVTG